MLADCVKGNTIWQVSRFDVSFEEHLYDEMEKIIKKGMNQNIEVNRIGWFKNIYQNTDIKALIDSVPKFEGLNIWQREIILGQAKDFVDGLFRKGDFKPYDVEIVEGNTFLNEGINNIWDILCGNGSTTLYNNANARLGVGNDGTAPAATQTGLLRRLYAI